MGGHPWYYFVDFQPDINAALQELRKREFEAGRYNPVIAFPEFPVEAGTPNPGPSHSSIDEALAAADVDGTRSILDMQRVSARPDFSTISPLSEELLVEVFGTNKPTREMVESSDEIFEMLERGQGVYVVVYQGETPTQIFFAGYSFD